jgi:hypothetical protein
MRKEITLFSTHAKLAELVHAVRLTLAPLNVKIEAVWREGTYLCIEVECRFKDSQLVCDRLMHGALADKYDYRFKSVCRQTGVPDDRWITVAAYPDMQHDEQKVRHKCVVEDIGRTVFSS